MTAAAPARPGAEPLRDVLGRLSSVQKGAAGAPAYSRFVNRPAGRLLAALGYRAGLTPNAVTALSALCTFGGLALLVALPVSWPSGIGVAACLAVGYALDSADGQLARLRGGGSPAGEWLDHVVDGVKTVALPLAVVLALYRSAAVDRGWLLVPLGFAVVAVAHLFAQLLNEQLRRHHGARERAAVTSERPSVLRSLLVLPTDYGLVCLVFLLLGSPVLFLTAYGVLFAATTGYVLLACVRWFREMEQLGG